MTREEKIRSSIKIALTFAEDEAINRIDMFDNASKDPNSFAQSKLKMTREHLSGEKEIWEEALKRIQKMIEE